MNHVRRWPWVLLLIRLLLAPAPSLAADDTDQPHRIAVLLPQTGPFAPQGQLQKKGYTLAEAQMQKAGQGVSVRYFDTGPPTDDVQDLLYRQVIPWKPDLVVGPYDSR